jgi:hypothetical protein
MAPIVAGRGFIATGWDDYVKIGTLRNLRIIFGSQKT